MYQPIRCIPSLVHHLSAPYVSDPFSIVSRYHGNDWKKMPIHHPLSLFRNEYMELVLWNWDKGRINNYNNNYSTVHTRVLEGLLHLSHTPNKYETTSLKNSLIRAGQSHTFHPFSKASLFAKEKTTTIQLYYYQNMY